MDEETEVPKGVQDLRKYQRQDLNACLSDFRAMAFDEYTEKREGTGSSPQYTSP